MNEYRDGTFGPMLPTEDAINQFLEACESGTAKALHVGTREELEAVKNKRNTEDRLDDIERKIREMQARESETIIVPTAKERLCFGSSQTHHQIA